MPKESYPPTFGTHYPLPIPRTKSEIMTSGWCLEAGQEKWSHFSGSTGRPVRWEIGWTGSRSGSGSISLVAGP